MAAPRKRRVASIWIWLPTPSAAANIGFGSGQAVKVADLVSGLTPPVVAPMPNRETKIPMPPR
jgi:hypothetical protein